MFLIFKGMSISILKVLRSLAFTPSTIWLCAFILSANFKTSTALRTASWSRNSRRILIPSWNAFCAICKSFCVSKILAISRTASAPHLYATSISSGSRRKSFLRTAVLFPILSASWQTFLRSSSEPLK